ncbi:uncharacterized protein NESG_00521 [Nematocida ausubeli]|uniref:Uncharacterized protein n=1 Tax=Nematocida ausubeli (strain ATCC PRA-371 / ERTm2) TaxID=1913371 RepID=A0A086J5M4_NEMA1|nr:uncharacterized protein NESG_00521 [Nematocida ausubeli]KAI5136250.1 hypothetical protein NEAUS06_1824 [Nematocida ausubeli]KAI5137677.1 hypothetical protein NEAUS07_2101 [Nematocida ausubeli]KAI5150121.1 hypothetical protein NEAUS05_2040 [Nematocida ausubeli]KFG27442.1 hypothetical protein NESG_00521 [Nematocida ausubeli]
MDLQQNIYWHKKGIKIEFDQISSEEVCAPDVSNIFAPGPRINPPFSVEILSHKFNYIKNDNTTYIIRISADNHSWTIIKEFTDILELISLVNEHTDILAKLKMKGFKSIDPKTYPRRNDLIKFIIRVLLDNSYKFIQQFILTNICTGDIRFSEDKISLVEAGWFKWKGRSFVKLNNLIFEIVHDTVRYINKDSIIISDNTVMINNRKLVALDDISIKILREWIW